jgi:hypothetical protein
LSCRARRSTSGRRRRAKRAALEVVGKSSQLEYLVTTATESLDRASRQERRPDDREQQRASTLRSSPVRLMMTNGDMPIHEQAAVLLAEHFPLNEEGEE